MDKIQIPDALRDLLGDEATRNAFLSQLGVPGTQSTAPANTMNRGYAQAAISARSESPIMSDLGDPDSPPYVPEGEPASRPSGKRARRGGHASGPSHRSSQRQPAPRTNLNDNLTRAGNPRPKAKPKPKSRAKPSKAPVRPVASALNYGDAIRAAAAANNASRRRFIAGIDFGTTFTSVSYCVVNEDDDDDDPIVFPEQIGVIRSWENCP